MKRKTSVRKRRMTPGKIAVWQFSAYVLLLLLVWANEVLDFSTLIYGTAPRGFDVVGACLVSAFVLTTAIVNIGHTSLTQTEMLQGLITVCAKCRKIRVNEASWDELDAYIGRFDGVDLSHGLCPDCCKYEMDKLPEPKSFSRV